VLISANVTNADLQLVAWFENNTWKCPPDSLGIGDRNYNSQAFEVVDRNNVSIFSIQIVALNTIQIGGLFKYSDGSVIAISDNGLGAESEPNQATIEKFLVPIFKYPSNKYLGELVNPPNPQNNASNVPLNNWDQLFFEASVINTIGYFVLGSGVFFVILAEIVREKEQHDKDKLKDMLKEKASLNNRPKKRK
jgi:hypothetical protein